jgi:hypothetical protein
MEECAHGNAGTVAGREGCVRLRKIRVMVEGLRDMTGKILRGWQKACAT